jgi:opacity protein-like surface antigen
MRKTLFVVSFLTAFCLNGFAQKNELAVIAGAKITPQVGNTTNQTTFATKFAIEANYAAQLAHVPAVSLHLEFPFVASPSTDLTTSNLTAVKSYSSFFFTPALRLKILPESPFSPWISGGGGFAHFNPSSTTQAGTTVTTDSTTTSAVQAGAGADFHPPLLPVAFRFEVRDFYTGIPNLNTVNIKVRHNLLVGGGIVLRF